MSGDKVQRVGNDVSSFIVPDRRARSMEPSNASIPIVLLLALRRRAVESWARVRPFLVQQIGAIQLLGFSVFDVWNQSEATGAPTALRLDNVVKVFRWIIGSPASGEKTHPLVGLYRTPPGRLSTGLASISRRRTAEEKGLAQLKQWLSPAQLAQYEKYGYFEVTGGETASIIAFARHVR
jgi:hypothetical protein